MSSSGEKDNGILGGANTSKTTPLSKGKKWEVNETLALYSILVPLCISIVFFAFEIIGLYNFSPESISGELILPMIIRYLAPSVFSSCIFMVLQQFFLLVPAGFDPKRGALLFLAVLVFTSFYSVYLVGKQDLKAHIIILITFIIFFLINLLSLFIISKKLDNKPFSGL